MNKQESVEVFKDLHPEDTSGEIIGEVYLDDGTKIGVDCLGVSGGWNPNLHLTCHQRGRPKWNEKTACFIPNSVPQNMKEILRQFWKHKIQDVL